MNKLTRRILQASFTALCGLVLSASPAEAARKPTAKNRQVRQQTRIGHGVKNGSLTKAETLRLQRNAARIHRSTRRDRIDGGVFTPKERIEAQRKLNRQSGAIHKQKTDGQTR